MAGVEVRGDLLDGEDANAGREDAVEGAVEVEGGDGDVQREGGDLGEGVNSGVGAAGALGEHGFAGDVKDGLGQGALDGGEVGLDLPAVVGRAVVGEGGFPVGHGCFGRYHGRAIRRGEAGRTTMMRCSLCFATDFATDDETVSC